MQKYEYRTPRYLVDLPIVLNLENSSIPGRCKEISKEGMRAELGHPVAADSSGTVSISYKGLALELPICVAHSGPGQEGFRFVLGSEEDKSAVERLVSLLAAATGQPGPVLVR